MILKVGIGSIVNITSMGAKTSLSMLSAYWKTKAALYELISWFLNLTELLAFCVSDAVSTKDSGDRVQRFNKTGNFRILCYRGISTGRRINKAMLAKCVCGTSQSAVR